MPRYFNSKKITNIDQFDAEMDALYKQNKHIEHFPHFYKILKYTIDYVHSGYYAHSSDYKKYKSRMANLLTDIPSTDDISFEIKIMYINDMNKYTYDTKIYIDLYLSVKESCTEVSLTNVYSSVICDEILYFVKKLSHLDLSWNYNVTNIDKFANTLKYLKARHDHVTDKMIENCHKIIELNACYNPNITTCEPFAKTLRKLDASSNCGITNDGLKNCHKIRELNVSDNKKITSCEPFKDTLEVLIAYGDECGITDDSLKHCHNIRKLDARDNPNITTCEPFADTLEELIAVGDECGITDDGIKYCHNLIKLLTSDNDKITAYETDDDNNSICTKDDDSDSDSD